MRLGNKRLYTNAMVTIFQLPCVSNQLVFNMK